MSFKFPFTNYHELNLDWILKKLGELFEASEENVDTINTYEGRLTAVEGEVVTIGANAAQALQTSEAAQSAAVNAQRTGDTALALAQTAQSTAAGAINASGTAIQESQFARQEAQQAIYISQNTAGQLDGQIAALQAESARQQQAIEDKGDEVIASIPSDYTELENEVDDLQSAFDKISENTKNLFSGIDTFTLTDAAPTYSIPFVINNAPFTLSFACDNIEDVTSIAVATRTNTNIQNKSVDVALGTRASVTFENTEFTSIRFSLKSTHLPTSAISISDIQIELGTEATTYVPYYSAVDFVAREEIELTGNYAIIRSQTNAEVQIENLENNNIYINGTNSLLLNAGYFTLPPGTYTAKITKVSGEATTRVGLRYLLDSIDSSWVTDTTQESQLTFNEPTTVYFRLNVGSFTDCIYTVTIINNIKPSSAIDSVARNDIINIQNDLYKPVNELKNPVNYLPIYNVYNCVDKSKIKIDANSKLIVFGDSITAGGSWGTSWVSYMQDITGCRASNYAVAGALFGESVRESSYWISTQIASVTSQDWNAATLIIIAAGTNDAGYNTADTELFDKVQSAINTIIQNTQAPILFITPIKRGARDNNAEFIKLPYISGVIEHVALINRCSVVCGLNFPIPCHNNGVITDLTASHIHPNSVGGYIYAMCIINAIN